MSSSPAPYATHEDPPNTQKTYQKMSPVSVAPWEKDQSPKMQSKGGDYRRANQGVIPHTAQSAPYGTADNLPKSDKTSSPFLSAKKAPFGTSDNAADTSHERYDDIPSFTTPQKAPYGTADNLPKTENVASPFLSASKAPYGTSDNAHEVSQWRSSSRSVPPFGTAADLAVPHEPKAHPAVKNQAPWERDESKYTHRGRGSVSARNNAPYATE